MDTETQEALDASARRILAEAQSAGSDLMFSATGFARENISILHQQMRCVHLAWALRHAGRVRPGDVVAIVGGSFSGLMLSVALALAGDAIVYMIEKEKRLLHRFLDKSHRHLSPNLNSRYLGPHFHPTDAAPHFNSPIFKWSGGTASEVASQWLKEFEQYESMLPIFSLLGYEVTRRRIERRNGRLLVDLSSRKMPHLRPLEVDILIDATGFGDESNPWGLTDFSYWESGHRLIYDHLPRACSVLVSGCGDSGLIEAMHYAIKGFSHDMVENLWPYGAGIEARLDLGVEHAKLDSIFKSGEIERYEGQVISEVCWWLDTWFRLECWRSSGWSLRDEGQHATPIFEAIEEALRSQLAAAFPGRNPRRLPWSEREAFAVRLPLKVQLSARKAACVMAEKWISRQMKRLADGIPLRPFLALRRLTPWRALVSR